MTKSLLRIIVFMLALVCLSGLALSERTPPELVISVNTKSSDIAASCRAAIPPDTGDAGTRWYRREAPERDPHKLDDINLYDQPFYTKDRNPAWKLGGYDRRDLAAAGCGVFSVAHMLQWLEHTRYDDALLAELVRICADPNGNYNHITCTHDKELSIRAVYAQAFEGRVLNVTEPAKTVEAVQAFFHGDVRRALRLWTTDHRCVGIEEMTVDGVSYIHVLDSNWGSYFYRAGFHYFFYEDGKMVDVKYRMGTYGTGSDYWLQTADVLTMQFLDAWESLNSPGGAAQ